MQRLLRNFLPFLSSYGVCYLSWRFCLDLVFWDRLFCNHGSGFDLAILLPQLLRAGMTGERNLIQLCLPFYNCPSSNLEAILCWQHTLIWIIPMLTDGSCLVRTHGERRRWACGWIWGQDGRSTLWVPLLFSDTFPRQNKLSELNLSLLLPLSAFSGCDEWKEIKWKVWFYTVSSSLNSHDTSGQHYVCLKFKIRNKISMYQ